MLPEYSAGKEVIIDMVFSLMWDQVSTATEFQSKCGSRSNFRIFQQSSIKFTLISGNVRSSGKLLARHSPEASVISIQQRLQVQVSFKNKLRFLCLGIT